ncbi:MAG: hypothetical protein MJZ81_06125 [Bacteroidales bacterium]|nr:hypothetical protein [Bacteroidales bacterium]
MQITISFNSGERTVYVNDDSFLYQSLFGEDSITLRFSLNESVDFPIGSSITYEGAAYRMYVPAVWTRRSSSIIDYTLIFEGAYAELRKYRLRNIQDGRLKFSMNATPEEFMKLLVGNLNQEGRSSGWRQTCALTDIDGRTLEFNHTTIADALSTIAEEFDTEYRVSVGNDGAKVIELGKVEFHKEDPMPLSYGKGNGFLPGTGRTNSSDDLPVEILYVQGGSRNIDRSRYGSADLLLPKGKTLTLDGKTYESSQDGFSIKKSGQIPRYGNEDSIDLTEIYPKRVGQVTAVELVDADKHFYDIMDNTIEDSLDYDKYLIDGEDMTIIFQSGMLAGREFKINKYTHTSDGVPARRFEITPEEFDGLVMPSGNYIPRVGDKYAVFGCSLPQSYIADDSTETGAEWEMFREAARYLSEHSDFKFTFTGELQEKWVKNNWNTIGDRIRVGSYIRFSDTEFVPDGVDIRITGVKRFLNKGYSPTVELSNNVSQGRVSTLLKEVPMQEVSIQESYDRSVRFTKRRFRDATETMTALMDAKLGNFSGAINPIAVQTMQALIGDESLQFRFVDSATNPKTVSKTFEYRADSGTFLAEGGILQHMTLGISSTSSGHDVSEYKFWTLPDYESGDLRGDLSDRKYYLYAKCSKDSNTGSYVLSETAIGIEQVVGFYHLLVGILNSEYDGDRSFATLFGFTEILPGRVITDRIVSGNGESWFDLLRNTFRLGDRLSFDENGLVLRGTLVQTGSGDVTTVGAWCGEYSPTRRYALGDEVYSSEGGVVSTYRYINSQAGAGHPLNDDNYWIVSAQGERGADGTSVRILGSYNSLEELQAAHPTGNEGDGYIIAGDLYVWDGASWHNVGSIQGPSGADGVNGKDGVSIVFKGSYDSHPANPQNGWAYYNRATGRSYVYQDGTWYQMSVDGVDGANGKDGNDGLSIVWKGDSATPPANPQTNWAYRDTDNGRVYIYDGTSWKLMTHDGSDGVDGADGKDGVNGTNGLSVYITYNDNAAGNPPSAPAGNGTSGGWHTNPTNASVWMSQKVAASASSGTWGTPIRIKGTDGVNGTNGKDGKDGTNGTNGTNGVGISSTAIAYATSSSGTTVPSSGWQDQSRGIPAANAGYYLWTRTTITYSNGTTSTSYSAARQGSNGSNGATGATGPQGPQGPQGAPGATGPQGATGPASPFQGTYNASRTYYGNNNRCDVVFYNSRYYIAKSTAGAFSGKVPTNTTYWNDFGAVFDSIATGFLLAEQAFVNNLGVRLVKVTDSNGNVIGGFMPANADGNGNYILWAGGSGGADANFSVQDNREVKVNGALVAGSVAEQSGATRYNLVSRNGFKMDAGLMSVYGSAIDLISSGSISISANGSGSRLNLGAPSGALSLGSVARTISSNYTMPQGLSGDIYILTNAGGTTRIITAYGTQKFYWWKNSNQSSYSLGAYETVIMFYNNGWRVIGVNV